MASWYAVERPTLGPPPHGGLAMAAVAILLVLAQDPGRCRSPVALFFVADDAARRPFPVNLGGLRLSAYRMVLIVMFLADAGATPVRPEGADAPVRLAGSCPLRLGDPGADQMGRAWRKGSSRAASTSLNSRGAYLLARLYVRSYEDFAAVARAYVMLVLATLIFTVPEALTGIHILHDGIFRRAGRADGALYRSAHGARADVRPLRSPDPLRRVLGIGLLARLFRDRRAAADEFQGHGQGHRRGIGHVHVGLGRALRGPDDARLSSPHGSVCWARSRAAGPRFLRCSG